MLVAMIGYELFAYSCVAMGFALQVAINKIATVCLDILLDLWLDL